MLIMRRIPWWGWILLIALLLIAGALTVVAAMRQSGMRKLRAFAADMESSGRGIGLQALVDSAPPVDRGRQAAAWALMSLMPTVTEAASPTWGMKSRLVTQQAAEKFSTQRTAFIAALAGQVAAWRQLRASGPVVFGLNGWIREDLPDPASASIVKASACRVVNLGSMRHLAAALATDAALAADPGPALADLDALCAAFAPTGSLIDTMAWVAVCKIRDEARLEAALRGTDPSAWAAVVPDPVAQVGSALRGERLLFGGGFYQDIVSGRGIGTAPPGLGGVGDRFGQWVYGAIAPQDVLLQQRFLLLGEDLCRTGIGDQAPLLAELRSRPWLHPISAISIPNILESVVTAVQQETNARRFRLAGLLVHGWHADGSLPPDEAALPASCLRLSAATPRSPAIRYVRVSETCFRLWTDPATPPTDFLPAGRLDAPVPAKGPWADRAWWLELDLAGFGQP